MAIEAKTVDELLGQIDELQKSIRTAGDESRKELDDINVAALLAGVPKASGGKFDSSAWSGEPPDAQKETYNRLVYLRSVLRVTAGSDGPSETNHIMYATYASTSWILSATVLAMAVLAVLLWAIVGRWEQATQNAGKEYVPAVERARALVARLDSLKGRSREAVANVPASSNPGRVRVLTAAAGAGTSGTATAANSVLAAQVVVLRDSAIQAIGSIGKGGASESTVLLLVILLGAVGGSLHAVGSLVKYVGNRQLRRSWLLYYSSLPLVGGALATVVYMLLRVGILAPTTSEGSTTEAMNLVGIYAFAALTGMFATTATDKLRDVFATIFKADRPSKDAIGGA
jgi:hypothetical protein